MTKMRFGKGSSASKQATAIVNQLRKDRVIPSIRTGQNYRQALNMVAEKAEQWGLPIIKNMTRTDAKQYLVQRSLEVGQSTLNQERQALQMAMQHVSGQLADGEKLTVVKTQKIEKTTSRFYSQEQIQAVRERLGEKNKLSLDIANAAGLRASELLTIRRLDEQQPDTRPTNTEKFTGRDGVQYVVTGKGGLVREVRLPAELASKLESVRLDSPVRVNDRGIIYQSHYQLSGGHRFSAAFTAASNRMLGWSRGVHGVRHTYAQERLSELRSAGVDYNLALETVSQERGHFRSDITLVYLR